VNSVGETSLTCPIQQMLFEDNAARQIRAMQFPKGRNGLPAI
jgi:hypothetical protein